MTSLLVRNTVSAYKGGYLREDQVLSALSFASSLGDREAGTLLEECRGRGVDRTLRGKAR